MFPKIFGQSIRNKLPIEKNEAKEKNQGPKVLANKIGNLDVIKEKAIKLKDKISSTKMSMSLKNVAENSFSNIKENLKFSFKNLNKEKPVQNTNDELFALEMASYNPELSTKEADKLQTELRPIAPKTAEGGHIKSTPGEIAKNVVAQLKSADVHGGLNVSALQNRIEATTAYRNFLKLPGNEKLSDVKSNVMPKPKSIEEQAGLFANQVIKLLKAEKPISIQADFSAQLQNAQPYMSKELFDEISAKIAK
jgi:hypothetical protein